MSAFKYLGNKIFNRLIHSNSQVYSLVERMLVNQVHLIAIDNRKTNSLNDLSSVEFCVFSQWGEDGIIDWLVERLPSIPKTFIEFGVEDYRQSNTRLLLQLRNWRGLVMDGSTDHIKDIRNQEIYWRYELEAKCAFIDRENINELISDAGFRGDIGLLSIDIDGNDYWVWDALSAVQPAIIVCEYNAVFGDIHQFTVPYRPDFQRTRAHHSNLYFGASIRALIKLAHTKGYQFVGTSSTGCNAFFVRNDLASAILNSLEFVAAYPSSVREARDEAGQLQFVGGLKRSRLIEHLPLVDVKKGVETTLVKQTTIYSSEWANRTRVLI